MKEVFPAAKKIVRNNTTGMNLSGQYPDKWERVKKILDKYGAACVTVEKPHKPATLKQNNTFHSLIGEYWNSGFSSFESYEELRNSMISCRGTQAVEVYIYQCRRTHKVFQHSSKNPPLTNIVQVGYISKRWAKTNLQERSAAIDFTKNEMIQAGVNTKKFDEILRGMGE